MSCSKIAIPAFFAALTGLNAIALALPVQKVAVFDEADQFVLEGLDPNMDYPDGILLTLGLSQDEILTLDASQYGNSSYFSFLGSSKDPLTYDGPLPTANSNTQIHAFEPHDGAYFLLIKPSGRHDGQGYKIRLQKHVSVCGDGITEGLELWDDGKGCEKRASGQAFGLSPSKPFEFLGNRAVLAFEDFASHQQDHWNPGQDCVPIYVDTLREFWIRAHLNRGESLLVQSDDGYSPINLVQACPTEGCIPSSRCLASMNTNINRLKPLLTAQETGDYLLVFETSSATNSTLLLEKRTPICGDGQAEGFELCDDGNRIDGDGCSSLCRLEEGTGQTCEDAYRMPDVFRPHDTKQAPMKGVWFKTHLDKGDFLIKTEAGVGSDVKFQTSPCGESAQRIILQSEPRKAGPRIDYYLAPKDMELSIRIDSLGDDLRFEHKKPTCGDGQKEGLEECDDHNLTPGDGCSPTCTLEPGAFCAQLNGKPLCIPVQGDGFSASDPILFVQDSLILQGDRFKDDLPQRAIHNGSAALYVQIDLKATQGFSIELSGDLDSGLYTLDHGQKMLIERPLDPRLAAPFPKSAPQTLTYHALKDERLMLEIKGSRSTPYAITLKRLADSPKALERPIEIAAFEALEGEDIRTLTLTGNDMASDFRPYEASPCASTEAVPTALFTVALKKGEILTAKSHTKAGQGPIPLIYTKTCSLIDIDGAKLSFENGLEYQAKNDETVRLAFATPFPTTYICKDESCREGHENDILSHPSLHRRYRFDLFRSRAKVEAPKLGNSPKAPIPVEFDARGSFVFEGQTFARDFKTPKTLAHKLDRKAPWLPTLWFKLDVQAGDQLTAQSDLGHLALIRLKGNRAALISDDRTPLCESPNPNSCPEGSLFYIEDDADDVLKQSQNAVTYKAKKAETLYLALSPIAYCNWEGCQNPPNDPYTVLKARLVYPSKAKVIKEAQDLSEGERETWIRTYTACPKEACRLWNHGPYKVEVQRRPAK